MRIYFSSMAHPKRLAKRLQKEVAIPLNRAQLACAIMFGYKDWHELEQVTAAKMHPPSKPDWLVSTEIAQTRRHAFCHRLYYFLNTGADDSFEYDEVWGLIGDIQPSGTMPDEAAFFDPRLASIFPSQWHLTDAAMLTFDEPPPIGFAASVGHGGSRSFELTVTRAVKKMGSTNEATSFALRDEVGFRSFAFTFPDRSHFNDVKDLVNEVAVIPFRFLPTIVDDVLLELELELHPAAFASAVIDAEGASIIAETICAYLRESAIWAAASNTCVAGAVNGIHVTLTGAIASPSLKRILNTFVAELEAHNENFNLEEEDPFFEDRAFLPIRELTVELYEEISEEAAAADFLANHGQALVRQMFREAEAMSHAPAILERLLARNCFSQYAEFCQGLDVRSLDDRRKFVKFVCSMEKARTIAPHHALFFRYDLMAREDGQTEHERERQPSHDDAKGELSTQDLVEYAAAARALGDDELALMIESDHDALWAACSAGRDELFDLIMEFAPPADEDVNLPTPDSDGARA